MARRKIVGFSMSPAVADEVDQLAKQERRTKSELFREMLRVYQRYLKQRDVVDEHWVMEVIREAQEEEVRRPMTQEEMLRESEELARYGAEQARKLGLKPKDIPRIIHDARQRRRNA
jgi:metal-responsive CopG/Arc/MetJ family transcriptional regulator